MRILKYIIGLILILGLGISYYLYSAPPNKNVVPKVSAIVSQLVTPIINTEVEISLDTANYSTSILQVDTVRQQWASANLTEKAQDSIAYLIGDSLAPYWIGTPWDFNGISKQPQKGNIACGYFVYGLLEDAGFRLPRIKLSQATSENSIKALVNESDIKRFSNKDMDFFLETLSNWGNGIYLVGLDYHIGLIQIKNDEIWMIHSSVYPPASVVIEDATNSLALINSNYRIVGKLNNAATIQKWLNGSYFSL